MGGPARMAGERAARMKAAKGMEDVVLGESSISLVDGEKGLLVYRGYDIRELAHRAKYESLVHLLLRGVPPSENPPRELVDQLRRLRASSKIRERLVDALDPTVPPIEALRTIASAMGDGTYGYPPTIEQGWQLIAELPTLLARFVRRARDLGPISPHPRLRHVANYVYMLSGNEPDPVDVRALENYFLLLADHGMNASTLALRVVISTNSDLFSGSAAALAALKGPAHGGAPALVSNMLDAVGSPQNAEAWIEGALNRGERLMGFGHRAYKVEDPRAKLLHEIAAETAEPGRFELAEAVERTGLAALERRKPGRRLYTNVEYYGAVVLEAVGLPRELFTPTFALARTAGWAAHALEQAADNRLIRPDVEYVGPPNGQRWNVPDAPEERA